MQYKFLYFLIFISTTVLSQITVNQNPTLLEIENVLFNNTACATPSSFSISGGTFNVGENSYAIFNSNGSGFPFDSGIVLSTGKAINTIGPSSNFSNDGTTAWGTDADLENILPTSNTSNATVLEFDFIPKTNTINFEYIFASEEYQEGDSSTCNFSDVFAFLIKPAGGTYTNIAVVPNTNIPVSVTTVHPYINTSCQEENDEYFGSWNNNYLPISFDGQTTILKAIKSDLIVSPPTTYHIKLVIADHINPLFDSAVFLNADSFSTEIDLGVDRLKSTDNALCNGDTLPLESGASTAQWFKYNQATSTYDFLINASTYIITSAIGSGKYKVIADFGGSCISEGEIIVEYDSVPLRPSVLLNCISGNPQFSTFDLFEAFPLINYGNNTLVIEGFYHDQTNAELETNKIINAQNYPYTIQNEIVVARVRSTSGCINYVEVTLVIHQTPLISDNEIVFYCINNFPNTIPIESGFVNGLETDYTYKWFKDNQITNFNTNSININVAGNYWVEITDAEGCKKGRLITVKPTSKAMFEKVLITDSEYYKTISLIVKVLGLGNYKYALDLKPSEINNQDNYQESNVFKNIVYGLHTLFVMDTNENGCDILIKDLTLLNYSKFITPNNDGLYDYWNIDNLNAIGSNFNTISNITIFNRYGKIMANINPFGLGWDGNYQGKPAPPSEYWFHLELIDFNGKHIIKKGHFSLKRIK